MKSLDRNIPTILNRYLAKYAGISRRQADKAIKQGRIKLNSQTITNPPTRINPQKDIITINSKIVKPIQSNYEYFLINKPVGYVSSTKTDSSKSPPVTDLIPSNQRLYPIGRLDINSEGLLILTNDGNLTYQLTHPKHQIEKEYHVLVSGNVTDHKIKLLRSGMQLSNYKTQPCYVDYSKPEKDKNWIKFILKEGKNRQIRRMCGKVDLHVNQLIRVRIGDISISNLRVGKYRPLTRKEINSLLN